MFQKYSQIIFTNRICSKRFYYYYILKIPHLRLCDLLPAYIKQVRPDFPLEANNIKHLNGIEVNLLDLYIQNVVVFL